ncbi:hypothetical protein [Pantoea sp.]|uniref:beta family protein n=1 Tax=Pantoea sp. TaxID=69393 RepID=UPI0031DD1536
MSINYFPIIKTTIAEMRALKNLNIDAWQKITPILELTKSRKGKNNQDSNVYKKIDELCQVIKSRELILDLTTIDALSNGQIESFQDDSGAFNNWCNFIDYVNSRLSGVIPVLLAYPDSTLNELLMQLECLSKKTGKVAIRIPIFEEGLGGLFNNFVNVIKSKPNLIHSIIFDASFINKEISQKSYKYIIDFINYFLSQVGGGYAGNFIFCSEHYPANITEYLKKEQDQYNNSVDFFNVELYKKVKSSLLDFNINNIMYGDYGCIHPFRNDVKAYNWIPRIDYPTTNKIHFSKIRRDVGGYSQCAKNIVKLSEFQNDTLKCWGMEQIVNASRTKPGGLNPSYWISVRSNIHMTRMTRGIK